MKRQITDLISEILTNSDLESMNRKNIIFYENLKLTQNNTFTNFFVIEFFLIIEYS